MYPTNGAETFQSSGLPSLKIQTRDIKWTAGLVSQLRRSIHDESEQDEMPKIRQ